MKKTRKQRIIERIVIFSVAAVVLGLLVFFFSSVFVPFIRLEAARDFDGARQLLLDRGVIGFLTVSLIEALQMVVIFIPAEFIQLTAGMSYPWWLAILLCDLGVVIGSSIIYFLVNVFRFNGDILNKQDQIEKYERISKANSTMVFMYLLFIMPIVPFGAICYYGSGKKMPFGRYVLTTSTGAIPSILTSILTGTAIKEFIADSLPIWLLILIIVLAAALLFVLLVFVIKKFFFKGEEGAFSVFMVSILSKAASKLLSLKVRYDLIGAEKVREMKGPFIYLSEHHSALDVAALYKIDPDKRLIGVINEHLFRIPVLGKLMRNAGHISKKLFYPDIPCLKKIIKTIQGGLPVAIFPDAKLSTDGGPSYIDDSIAGLAKKLEVPVVLVEIRNNYFIKPKWRKGIFRGTVEVEVKRIVGPEELRETGLDELAALIRENLSYNEFSKTVSEFRSPNKAKGLHRVLYLCPHCRTLYSNTSSGNVLTCRNCGKTYHIGRDYRFTDEEIPTVYDYYQKIREIERETLQEIRLDIPVDVKIFKDGVRTVRKEKGTFHLDAEKISFRSSVSDLFFEYGIGALEDIAYSVDEEFELYYKNELYYFYPPKNERIVCARVALVFELLRGEWRNERERERIVGE